MRLLLTAFLLSICLLLTAQVKPSLSVKTTVQPRIFDGKMILQRCSVAVKTDGITAVTFIELEFYNNRDAEIEGLYRFELRNGQVVTDFQLDLNGTYREGSIEEKWKASNAYNTIVGKRVDPALLTKDYDNHYSLRIYPVPAKQTRKVTITLHEVLPHTAEGKTYLLPFKNADTTTAFMFRFEAMNQPEQPVIRSSSFGEGIFSPIQNGYLSAAAYRSVVLNKTIEVLLPSHKKQLLLVKPVADKFHFALELHKEFAQYYSISPKAVTVFWDASSSSSNRDIKKEISFLKQYLLFHKTETVTIIPFRHKPFDTVVYHVNNKTIQQLDLYLSNLQYEGATGFGRLNLSTVNAAAVLLFSDGYSTYGKSKPNEGTVLVYAIHSAPADAVHLKKIVGNGGAVINLQKLTISQAIEKASLAERMLLRVESASGKTIIESSLPDKIDKPVLIYGTMHAPTDTLRLYYGNSLSISNTESVILSYKQEFSSAGIDRLPMLMRYRQMLQNRDWNDVLDFGLDERVVTPQTAFIVLERVEDYIRYNIKPSKDLEEECRRLNYVKKDTRIQRRSLQEQPTEINFSSLVAVYNQRIKNWDATASGLNYQPMPKPIPVPAIQMQELPVPESGNATTVQQALQGRVAGISIERSSELSEVVVVGYASARKKEVTGSVAYIQQRDVFQGYTNLGDVLAGRVPGLQVMSNGGSPGTAPDIRIRGAVSLGASAQPLYVIDGVPVAAETLQQVLNVNDIESVTVLKDASSTALYGSRGANGVILIQLKKGKQYNPYYYSYRKYKLSDQEDVDYMQEMKETDLKDKVSKYKELKVTYGSSAAFHTDMAEHFFACGLNKEALNVLMSAMEFVPNDFFMQRTAAFILERWKQYNEAEELLTDLLSEHVSELYLYRDLAWVYYQQQKYQQAVDLLYKGININFGSAENQKAGLKAMLLSDMNAMIGIHSAQLDLSVINSTLVKPLPADLVIVAEDNMRNKIGLTIYEPGLHAAVASGNPSKSGGFISTEEYYAYYNAGIECYTIKKAAKGKYKIAVKYYGGAYNRRAPSFIRLIVYRNYGREDQSIQIETIAMDNQYGEIEIAETKY